MASLYLPTYFHPKNESINPAVINNCTCQINGSICVAYDLTIMKNSDSSVAYNSTKITPTTPLYNKQTLTHAVPALTLTAGIDYKWSVKLYYDSTNYVESGENFFTCYSVPTLTFSPPATITAQTYSFTVTYEQTEDIQVNRFKFILYDSNNTLLEDSDYIYSANITYSFDGFINGNTYRVKCVVENEKGVVVDSGIKSFTVSYSEPTVGLVPSATLLSNLGAIKVNWGEAIQILGVATGSYSYIVGGGISLASGSQVDFTFSVPVVNTVVERIDALDSGFSGILYAADDDSYVVGYDGTRFYFNNNGTSAYGLPRTIPTSAFLIIIRPTNVVIKTDTYTETIQV